MDQLTKKDKEWLNKFTDEYINDSLDRQNLKNNLHNTKKLKKDCDDRNNARNRCIWTRAKASGTALSIESISALKDKSQVIDEDSIINYIDEKDNLFEVIDDLNNSDDSSGNDGEST